MAEYRGIDIMDFIIFLIKNKKIIIISTLVTLFLSYLIIFFFVKERFDSTALVIPSSQNSVGGISSLLSSFSNLPIDIGGVQTNEDIGMFETILFSRTTAEKMIDQFDLMTEYGQDSREEAIKIFYNNLFTNETDAGAYSISVRSETPIKSAEMTNFLVSHLNEAIINLNITKSKENKLFLQRRVDEIYGDLKLAEDSLSNFQKKTGVYIAEDQTKASIEAYVAFEAELAKKEIEYSVLKQILGSESPKLKEVKLSVNTYREKVNRIISGEEKSSLLLGLNKLPENTLNYFRLFRKVKISNQLLEFIIPLYEQAKFEEQKDLPILQIIDYAKPPEKKSYPLRILFSFIITTFIEIIVVLYLLVKSIVNKSQNPKLIFIKNELFSFKSRTTE